MTDKSVFSICTEEDYETDDEDERSNEETVVHRKVLFDNLDLLKGWNKEEHSLDKEESVQKKSRRKAEEELNNNMEGALKDNEQVDLADKEYHETQQENGSDSDDEVMDDINTHNQEEVRKESEIVKWDNKQEKMTRKEKMDKF